MTFKFTIYPHTRLLTKVYQKYENRITQEVQSKLLLATDNVEIETDAVRLRQMVEHLLDNAAKFTVKGHMDIGYAYMYSLSIPVAIFQAININNPL